MMLKLITFFAVLSPILCVKLSEEFDAERAETCGIPSIPEKPSPNPPDDKAPWTMGITYSQIDRQTKKLSKFYLSGLLVSARHVIVPGHIGVEIVDKTNNKQWKWIDNTNVDFKTCQENEMEIPENTLKQMKISISTCQDADRCGTHIERSVINGWYLGNCQPGEIPFGILLLEISSNVPQDADFFVPVCIPAEKKPVFIKDTVHFDSFRGDKKVVVISDPATIKSCSADIGKFVQSVCATLSTCNTNKRDGRGGTLVKKIDGRETGIAMLYSFYGKGCDHDHYVSIGFFKDKLCSLAGICKVTTQPQETSSQSGTQHILVFIILAFFL